MTQPDLCPNCKTPLATAVEITGRDEVEIVAALRNWEHLK